MDEKLLFTLSYTGSSSDEHEIDFYDVAQALMGFQRSIALTTHLVLNDEIITQAPSLKGAKLLALPPEEGSWKITAVIALTGIYNIATAPPETPLGHLVYSAYDYVVSESLGYHVDYKKSLGQQYEEIQQEKKSKIPILSQNRFDSLSEKCETALKDMHRPIFGKGTAEKAEITANIFGQRKVLGHPLDENTFEFIHKTNESDEPELIIGQISSYNSNTFKGRIYTVGEGRPVPFELFVTARDTKTVLIITNSLTANAQRSEGNERGIIYCRAYRKTSRTGMLKGFKIIFVSDNPIK